MKGQHGLWVKQHVAGVWLRSSRSKRPEPGCGGDCLTVLAGQGEAMAVFPAEMVRDVTTIYKSHFDNRNSISLWHQRCTSHI